VNTLNELEKCHSANKGIARDRQEENANRVDARCGI